MCGAVYGEKNNARSRLYIW